MFHNFINWLSYKILIYRIKDKELKNFFYELTCTDYNNWDSKIFERYHIVLTNNYRDLEKVVSKHIKLTLLCQPETWALYMKDDDFLDYIELQWYKIYSVSSSCNIIKENKKFSKVIDKFNELYPERFIKN